MFSSQSTQQKLRLEQPGAERTVIGHRVRISSAMLF
jgi:hypothetical protein